MSVSLLVAAFASANADWETFKIEFNRSYSSADEEAYRHDVFLSNLESMKEMSRLNPDATFGVNEFADMSKSQWAARMNRGRRAPGRNAGNVTYATFPVDGEIKSKIDWREEGAVTGVKNQGDCGSCWSFSMTGVAEGANFLVGNKLTSLSEQFLVSCDYTAAGCQGGDMQADFSWLISTQGGKLPTEISYPYTSGSGSQGACKSHPFTSVGATVTHETKVGLNEEALLAALQHGPVSIGVYAAPWEHYKGGILKDCGTNEQLDHGVLAVGYTPEYWIVKNSWGAGWGEEGYIRLSRATKDICLITSGEITTVTVAKQ